MRKTVTALMFASLLAASAQDAAPNRDPAKTAAYKAACGPVDSKLESTVSWTPLAPPDESKATVVFIQHDDQTNSFCFTRKCGGANVRLGVDGAWIGVTSGDSYIAVPLEPGNHHLCANWQSHFKKVSHHEVSLQPLLAEGGHTYYFLVHVSHSNGGTDAEVPFFVSLEPLNKDQANMLMEIEPQSSLKK